MSEFKADPTDSEQSMSSVVSTASELARDHFDRTNTHDMSIFITLAPDTRFIEYSKYVCGLEKTQVDGLLDDLIEKIIYLDAIIVEVPDDFESKWRREVISQMIATLFISENSAKPTEIKIPEIENEVQKCPICLDEFPINFRSSTPEALENARIIGLTPCCGTFIHLNCLHTLAQERCKSIVFDEGEGLFRIIHVGEDFHPNNREGEAWCECPMCRRNLFRSFNNLERDVQMERFRKTNETHLQMVRMLNHRLAQIYPGSREALRIKDILEGENGLMGQINRVVRAMRALQERTNECFFVHL
jgi:hypothetical protein